MSCIFDDNVNMSYLITVILGTFITQLWTIKRWCRFVTSPVPRNLGILSNPENQQLTGLFPYNCIFAAR